MENNIKDILYIISKKQLNKPTNNNGTLFDSSYAYFYIGKLIIYNDNSYNIDFINYLLDDGIKKIKTDNYKYFNTKLIHEFGSKNVIFIEKFNDIKENFNKRIKNNEIFINNNHKNYEILLNYYESYCFDTTYYLYKKYMNIFDNFYNKKIQEHFNKIDEIMCKIVLPAGYGMDDYFIISPQFAQYLEEQQKFYIGTWDDVKDYVIKFEDTSVVDK